MRYVYTWYDTPNGKNCPDKVKYLVDRGFMVGTVLYPMSAFFSGATTLRQLGMAYVRVMVPVMSMSAMFAVTTCTLCKYVPMDSKLSFAAGGIVTGSLLGAFTHSRRVGFHSSVFLAVVAAVIEGAHEMGYRMKNEQKPIGSPVFMMMSSKPFESEPQRPLPSSMPSA